MGLGYALAYRLGVTPWENAAEGGREQFDRLLDQVDDAAGPPRKALDLGCGRGLHVVNLAQRGWDVTGVDTIGRALAVARERVMAAGVTAHLVEGDVTALPPSAGSGFTFVLDVGCFHGLTQPQRLAYGREVNRVTAPGAHLLLLAFQAGGRGPLPKGADQEDISAALPGWSVAGVIPADTSGMPGPLRARAPQFYRLTKGPGPSAY